MFRYLVAHLPGFRLERCGWSAEDAVVLADDDRSALRVCAASPPALRVGVRPGMTVAEARALLPALQVERLDAPGEQLDLEALTEQLVRLSPTVGALPPDAVVAEISRAGAGAARLLDPRLAELELMARLRRQLEGLGHRCQLAVADDPTTALTCATWAAGDLLVPPGEAPAALAPLPLEALGLPEAELSLLQALGLQTVGDFAALPGGAIAGRLGPAGVAAHALARGAGPRGALQAWGAAGPLVVSRDLPDPVVEVDALLFVLNGLLREAASLLAAEGQAASELVVDFGLSGGLQQQLRLRLGRPSRDPSHMLRLLRQRMDRLSLRAPAERLQVELPDPQPFSGRQRDLLDPHRGGEAVGDVVAALLDAMGPDSVGVAQLADRHRPEAAWALGAPARWMAAAPLPPGPGPRSHVATRPAALREAEAQDPAAAWAGHQPAPPPLRPALLIEPPIALEVRVGRWGRPEAVHHEGRWQPLRAAHGPERLAGEWWAPVAFTRSYWRVELWDGRGAWVYAEDGRWALHGWFEEAGA
jgi:protein ImuB